MPATVSSSSQAWKNMTVRQRALPPEKTADADGNDGRASRARAEMAKRPTQRRWPSAPPTPPAIARETAGSAASAADSTPAARRETARNRTANGNAPAESTSGDLPRSCAARPGRPAARPTATRNMAGRRCHEDLQQHHVVQCQRGVSVARKEPAVLELVAWVVVAWRKIDPASARRLRKQVDRGQAQAPGRGNGGAQQRRP